MAPKVTKLNRYITLTPAHEAKIDELLQLIEATYDPLPPMYVMVKEQTLSLPAKTPTTHNPQRLYAYVFLHSRQWEVKHAMEMVKTVVEYREANGLNDSPVLPPAFAVRGWDVDDVISALNLQSRERPARLDRVCGGVDKHFSGAIHYWDRNGLPVLYLMIGTVDEPGLLKELKQMAPIGKSASEVLWEYVQHAVAVGELLCAYQQLRIDRGDLKSEGIDGKEGLIRSVTCVVDVGGLTYKMLWKPALDLFKHAMSNMFKYYPDCMHRIIVVNSPTMIMFAYNIVKGVFNEQVQKKISFYYKEDTFEALEQLIDKKYLPTFLGGACKCEGNCIGSHNPDDPKARQSAGGDDGRGNVTTEEIDVKAGSRYQRTFAMKKSDQVTWEFISCSGKETPFAVYFVPNTAREKKEKEAEEKLSTKDMKMFEKYLVIDEKPSEGAGSYEAHENGVLYMVWCNKQSWFMGRKMQMKVYLEDSESASPSSTRSH